MAPTRRGLTLSKDGQQRLESALKGYEQFSGERETQESLCQRAHLARSTLFRILNGRAVDRDSIQKVFAALDLELGSSDLSSQHLALVEDWGEAVDCSYFVGRDAELQTLKEWITQQRCRVITLLGMGGIGKTSLAIKTAEVVRNSFAVIIWRSLRTAPDFNCFLSDLLTRITGSPWSQSDVKPLDLIQALRTHRVLLILDNVDSLLEPEQPAGIVNSQFRPYGDLISQLGAVRHESSIILTSREKFRDLEPLEGENLPVRSFCLQSLSVKDTQELLLQKGINSTPDQIEPLVARYSGNPLCLKLVATTVFEFYTGDVALFLSQPSRLFEDIESVLEAQFTRLTILERRVMYWLALFQDPVDIHELSKASISKLSTPALLKVLHSLSRRSLVDRRIMAKFGLQTVVAEFVTEKMISQWQKECVEAEFADIIKTHPLVYSQCSRNIQIAQSKLILEPLANRLTSTMSKSLLKQKMNAILQKEKGDHWGGYVAANIINLAVILDIELTSLDLTYHYIRAVSFQNINLTDVDMEGCTFLYCEFAQPYSEVMGIDWHPSLQLLGVAGGEGEILLWDLKEEHLRIMEPRHTSHSWCVRFSKTGNKMVTTSNDRQARIWEQEFGDKILNLNHPQKVYRAVFSPDEEYLATACADGKIRIWATATGKPLKIFEHDRGHAMCLAYLRSDILVSGGEDGKIYIWDIENIALIEILEHPDVIRSLDAKNGLIVSGCFDHNIYIWNQQGVLITKLEGHHDAILCVRFSPDGKTVASASRDGNIGLWSLDDYQPIWLQDHDDWVRSICFSPDGKFLASGGDDQTIRIWDVENRSCKKVLRGYSNGILTFSERGGLIVTGSADNQTRLWLCTSDKQIEPKGKLGNSYTNGTALAISPDGEWIAANTQSGTIQIWNRQDNSIVFQLNGHNHFVTSMAFDPLGEKVVSVDNRGYLRLWSTENTQCLWVASFEDTWVWDVQHHPLESLIFTGSDDGKIRVWNHQGECIDILEGHSNAVSGIDFLPDGRIVSCSLDYSVRIWDLSHKTSDVLLGSEDILWSVCIGPTGEIFAAGADRHIHGWIGKDHISWPAHDRTIKQLSYYDGVLISGSIDETLKVWNWRKQECLSITQMPRIYEALNLGKTQGLSPLVLSSLQTLGAVI